MGRRASTFRWLASAGGLFLFRPTPSIAVRHMVCWRALRLRQLSVDERWVCPLAPIENRLEVRVEVGECPVCRAVLRAARPESPS